MTLPNNLVGWFRKIGFKQIVDETNLVVTKDEKSIREAARLYRDDFWVCLFVNEQLLYPEKQAKVSLTASHWIVLTSDVTMVNGNISMTVYSWGDGHRAVPYDPTQALSLTNFLRNYYGYVAARY
jgi:mRNA deadenylase 3'-5' endonuclease subunit Ccr4